MLRMLPRYACYGVTMLLVTSQAASVTNFQGCYAECYAVPAYPGVIYGKR